MKMGNLLKVDTLSELPKHVLVLGKGLLFSLGVLEILTVSSEMISYVAEDPGW